MNFYIYLTTFTFLALYLIWTKDDTVNYILKLWFLVMFIGGLLCSMNIAGFIVQAPQGMRWF